MSLTDKQMNDLVPAEIRLRQVDHRLTDLASQAYARKVGKLAGDELDEATAKKLDKAVDALEAERAKIEKELKDA